eukprot:9608278-Ditylum_brightwellii.AAC.1
MEGKGLETSDTKHLSKLTLFDNALMNSLYHMVSNMAALAADLTDDLFIVTTRIKEQIASINDNKECLDGLDIKDLLFINKIFYMINSTKDQYL